MGEPGFVHPTAVLEGAHVGRGTRIWAFVRMQPGSRVGDDCQLCDHCAVGVDAVVGNRVTIKEYAGVGEGVVVEDDVFLGPYCVTPNDESPRSRRMPLPEVQRRYSRKENWLRGTTIRRGASIGTRAVIAPGLEIGAFAMVGMGSVVHRDVPPHRLVLGNPARAVGWVCYCGERLARDAESEPWSCAACQRTFRETDAGLLHPLQAPLA